MKVIKNFPLWVAVYITTVELVFSLLPVVQNDVIEFKVPNKYYLIGFAIILLMCGCWYVYVALKGKLEPIDVSVVEIRKEALGKLKVKLILQRLPKMTPTPKFAKKPLNV